MASTPRFSQWKFSQPRPEPRMSPSAQSQRCRNEAIRLAVMPKMGVRRATRRMVLSPRKGPVRGSGGELVIRNALVFRSETPSNLQNPRGKTETAEHGHQPRSRVQPLVQKIADKSTEGDSANEGEGELKAKHGLLNKLRRLLPGLVRSGIVGPIVQRRSAPGAGTVQDTTPPRATQTPPPSAPLSGRC